MVSMSRRAWSAVSTGVLPRLTTYFGPRTACAGLVAMTRPTTQPVEAYPDRGQVLLHGRLGDLRVVDRIVAIGSNGMMAAVQRARSGALKPFLNPNHQAIASINSPMQCMMKEICAQCLQPPRTLGPAVRRW